MLAWYAQLAASNNQDVVAVNVVIVSFLAKASHISLTFGRSILLQHPEFPPAHGPSACWSERLSNASTLLNLLCSTCLLHSNECMHDHPIMTTWNSSQFADPGCSGVLELLLVQCTGCAPQFHNSSLMLWMQAWQEV